MVIYRYSQKIESKEEIYIILFFCLPSFSSPHLLFQSYCSLNGCQAAFKVLIGGLSRDINMFPQIHTFFRQRDIWNM